MYILLDAEGLDGVFNFSPSPYTHTHVTRLLNNQIWNAGARLQSYMLLVLFSFLKLLFRYTSRDMPRPIKNQPLNICFKLPNKCLEHCRRKMLVSDYDLICFSHFIVFCHRHEAATSHCCLTLHLSVICVRSCISYFVFIWNCTTAKYAVKHDQYIVISHTVQCLEGALLRLWSLHRKTQGV